MAWEIDSAHSQARFSVHHAGSDTIQGRFNTVRGHLHVDEQKPAHSWVDIEVDAASVNTGDTARDARLRSKQVLDAAKYPTITFKSVRVDHTGTREYTVTGELTLHGVAKPVTFDARFQEPGTPSRARDAALTVRTKITCEDSGMARAAFGGADQFATGEPFSIEIDLALVSRSSPG
jgi:polyisoprenoid-binding protein YceI